MTAPTSTAVAQNRAAAAAIVTMVENREADIAARAARAAAAPVAYWPVEIDGDDYDGGWHRTAAKRRGQRHRADRRAAVAAKAVAR